MTRKTLVLVLAGGSGSRLKGLTKWRAKPAVPFGGKYRIIDFALSNCVHSGLRRIGVLTPYTAEVNRIVADYIAARGYQVPVFGSFNSDRDTTVARITPQSIEKAVREIISHAEADAIFVSCTSVRLMLVCAELEKSLGIPLTSSNHAMGWHALRLAGIDDNLGHFGSLYELPLA